MTRRRTPWIQDVVSPSGNYALRYNENGFWEAARTFEWGHTIRNWNWDLFFSLWGTNVTGSASVAGHMTGQLRFNLGNTSNSTCRGTGQKFGWIGWANQELEWFVHLWAFNLSSTTKMWLKMMGADTTADPTAQMVGWRIDGTALKGIVHDGSSLHVVDLGVTGESFDLFLKFVPGDKVYWYVNGVLKGSSSDIPTTTRTADSYIVLAANNGTGAPRNNAFALHRQGWIAKNTG